MPLHSVGYREWDGVRSASQWRWLTIAMTGIRLVWRGTWLRRTIFFTWIPVIVLATGFFVFEQSMARPELRPMMARSVARFAQDATLEARILADPVSCRHDVWATLLLTFFRYPQAFVMMVVVGLIAPRLISYDLRSKGYLLYFSRPISVWEYLLGKSSIVWFYLAVLTMIPAILMYVIGLFISSEWSVIYSTWDLPFRIVGASLVLFIPTTALALAFSAITIESRYATFSWLATWVLGVVAYSVLTTTSFAKDPERFGRSMRNRRMMRLDPEYIEMIKEWEFVSPYHILGRVQQWVFGLGGTDQSIFNYLAILAIMTITTTAITYYCVARRLKW